MPKFPFKRPRIISKKFPRVDSTIEGVTKSLDDLVFTYSEQVDKTLQKKHIMMAMSSMALLLVLGSFISPKGKAESSVFYPETCLGGWINPQYAQGEQETTSNGDESQFTKDNSAVLPKNTNAEMYCGNFKGKFDSTTQPTKIIVSLALTKGVDLLPEDTLESGLVSSSSLPTLLPLLNASSTEDSSLMLASSTLEEAAASSSPSVSSSTLPGIATSSLEISSSTPAEIVVVATSTESSVAASQTEPSIMDGIIESLKDTINVITSLGSGGESSTDTVVIPPPVAPSPTVTEPAPAASPEPAPAPSPEPTSLFPSLQEKVLATFFTKVFAQEVTAPSTEEAAPVVEQAPERAVTSTETVETAPVAREEAIVAPTETTTTETALTSVSATPEDGTASSSVLIASSSEILVSSSTLEILNNISSSTLFEASSTLVTGTTTEDVATTTEENKFQNNFLEIFYTFDGVTWLSLGELNEISMKYRTFEIPVTASTTWGDMEKLQLKVVAKRQDIDTPTVYLDAMKVEVLYETVISHAHPDFARDTILKDEIVDNVRMITLINHETSLQEVWYMYLDEVSTSTEVYSGTSTPSVGTTTETFSTSTLLVASGTEAFLNASGTVATGTVATSSEVSTPVLNLLKNKWKKYEGADTELPPTLLIVEIKKQEEAAQVLEEEKEAAVEEESLLTNFASGTVRIMKGTFLNKVLIQFERNGKGGLWMYDIESGAKEKISGATSTSLSASSPIGVKGEYVFWLSEDKEKLFAFNITSREIQEKNIPNYDITKGERGEVIFETIPWKVILGADGFAFYSDSTGEVFSDENGTVAETLRQKLQLDTLLDKEELSNLNFQVEMDTPTEQ